MLVVRAVRRTFTGPAEFLADPASRARVARYLADMARPYGCEVPADLFGDPPSPDLGQSYGEMAQALIAAAVPPEEPADLLILAFSSHDMWPGRQTAAYLSHLTPGAPLAFAICDQGSAAAFTGLRIAREYAASAGVRRVLLIVAEQAALPYRSPVPPPAQHRGVAMLLADAPPGEARPGGDCAVPQVRLTAVRQHAGVPPGDAAARAATDLSGLTARSGLAAGRSEVRLVLGDALAALWDAPAGARVRVMPPGQPCTAVWWGLTGEFAGDASRPGLVVAADYDPGLRYLCLTAFRAGPPAG